MKFILLCILLFACNFSGNAIHFFNGTYEEALQLAKKEKKNLFISFTASWCGPCRMMKKVVFEDPQVVRYADQHYICLNADIEYPEFRLLQCRVNPNRAGIIPHICILTPDGKIIKESSSVTTGQMMKFLKADPRFSTCQLPVFTDGIPPPIPVPDPLQSGSGPGKARK